jgi:transposase-like protein
MTRAAIKNPEEITGRASADSYCATSEPKCAKSRVKGIQRSARKSVRLRNRIQNARKISDDDVLDAMGALYGGNSSVRGEARKLGVSHVALLKRIKSIEKRMGYHPSETDKTIIRAVVATGAPGALGRLCEIMGRTRAELLEAVR